MRAARFSDLGVSQQRPPPDRYPSPIHRPPWKENGTRHREPPRRNMGPGSHTGSDIIQKPLPLDRMTDTCKNINLPQTWFAGGNKQMQFKKCKACHKVQFKL